MTALVTAMGVSWPTEWDDPFIDEIELTQQDVDNIKEDADLMLIGGGTTSLVGDLFSWSAPFYVYSTRAGTFITISAGSVTVTDGNHIYFTPSTRPIPTETRTLTVGSAVPAGAVWIGTRSGSAVSLRSEGSGPVTVTLDEAYQGGSSITAASGAVTVTVPDTSNNVALRLTQNDVTNDPSALLITNTADYASGSYSIELAGTNRTIVSAGADLTIETTTSGDININPAVDVNFAVAGNSIWINGTYGNLEIYSNAANGDYAGVTQRVNNAALNLKSTGSPAKINLESDEDIEINAGDSITMGSSGDSGLTVSYTSGAILKVEMLESGPSSQINVRCDGNSSNYHSVGLLATNLGTGSAGLIFDAENAINIGSHSVYVYNADINIGTNSLSAARTITIGETGGSNDTIIDINSDTFDLNTSGDITIAANGAANVKIDGSGIIVDSKSTLALNSDGAMTFTATTGSGTCTLDATWNISLQADNDIVCSCTDMTIDATAGIALRAETDSVLLTNYSIGADAKFETVESSQIKTRVVASGASTKTHLVDINAANSGSGAAYIDLVADLIYAKADMHTDRWLSQTSNTFFGVGVVGAGNLTHTAGQEGYFNCGYGNNALYSITTGDKNCAVGQTSMYSTTTGIRNTALGQASLYFNVSGGSNTGAGFQALYTNQSGSYNTAIGASALAYCIGSCNGSLGYRALYQLSSGAYNNAVGHQALYSNISGGNNNAFGAEALYSNSASNNNAFGHQALRSNTTGVSNSAFGHMVLYSNTTGDFGVAVGYHALYNNVSGDRNIAVGVEALKNNTASYNTAIGYRALYSNTSGIRNGAIGDECLYSNSSGSYNHGFGDLTLRSNTIGTNNNAFGHNTLNANVDGNYNNAFGHNALSSNIGGDGNTAFGHGAAASCISSRNTAVGYQALLSSVSSGNQTSVGYQALYNCTGAGNLALGYRAGDNITTGARNIIIGYDVDAPVASGDYQLNIGNTIYGNTNTGDVGIGTSDLDGTPAIGRLVVKGSTNDGSTNCQIWRDSGEVNVASMDTDGVLSVSNIKVGTHSAIGAETVTGYITIKDSGGTDRKIAVVS